MNGKNIRSQDAYKNSFFISFFVSLLILTEFIPHSDQYLHWFVIPVTLSGILMGTDAVDWFRGRLNIFDPVGIIGLLGFHFFFLAPLLHIRWDSWLEAWYIPPPDWRPWLGYMAILNFMGLWMYRLARYFSSLPPKNLPNRTSIWRINQNIFLPVLSIALGISAGLQVLVYQKFGGVMGYINAVEEKSHNFQGMGVLFIVSESFPILAMMGFAVCTQRNKRLRTLPVLLLILTAFLVLQMLFGGLRGSRANTIWALFWALGIIHFWLRPVSKKEIAFGLVFILFFMYIYGFFKAGGLEGVQTALEGQEARTSLEQKSGRTWQGLLLGDLGRTDIQAYLLYRLMRQNSDYEYAWGRTYIAGLSIMIPGAILPNKPDNKSREGTEAEFGKGSYQPPDIWVSSKVYGLAGEAMLNFSPLAVPFAFIVLGFLVGRVQRCLLNWDASDSRRILLPMMVNFCFVVLVSDLDNDIFFLFKNAGFPVLVIALSSKKK